MKRFRIKSEYLTDVPKTRNITLTFLDGSTMSGTSYGVIDHPEFTKLRDRLEKEGYISTWRQVSNGDRVLKPFYLNGNKFDKDDKFCCACALKIQFKVAKQTKKKYKQ